MSKIVQQMRYLIGCFRSARWSSNVSKMLIKHYDNIKDVIKKKITGRSTVKKIICNRLLRAVYLSTEMID